MVVHFESTGDTHMSQFIPPFEGAAPTPPKKPYEYLSMDAQVSGEVRRKIDNGFHSHCPFKGSSAQLADFISIFTEVRNLPAVDFSHCFSTIRKILAQSQQDRCAGCTGKGLAFLKHLARGIGDGLYHELAEEYRAFASARDWGTDYEPDLLRRMRQLGILEG